MSPKQFILYTFPTPNGFPVSIFLEELKDLYPELDYDAERIDIGKNIQKEPWFLKINPNGRIPALVDRSRDNFAVFETSAIMLYLAQNYDKKFGLCMEGLVPCKVKVRHDGSMLPGKKLTQPLANHFNRFAPESIPYAKKRYLDETKRLYGVLEIRLKDRDWLAGPGRGKFTIADIKTFPWVRGHTFAGIETLDEFPNVKAWLERALERPAVKRGLEVGKA
ncbi:hypothetical protein H0H92_003399 [Tricholoma furcatifolium]|nr:hypothetical protein H0H92_003399 [Tricholoma furcatifolium]